jgi:acyl-CoA thioesterase
LDPKHKNDAGEIHPTGPHHFHMEDWISCAPFERLLHMDIVRAADGKATLKMPFLLDLAQGAGLMHGGALVSLADTAVVMAIKSLLPPQTHFATISMEAKFLRPVKKGVITAEAEVPNREGRELRGNATLYDEETRPVMEFSSVFKVAKDSTIRGISYQGQGPSTSEDRK